MLEFRGPLQSEGLATGEGQAKVNKQTRGGKSNIRKGGSPPSEEQLIIFKVEAFRVIEFLYILVKMISLDFNISQSISIGISHKVGHKQGRPYVHLLHANHGRHKSR